jgi:hypothetical protein
VQLKITVIFNALGYDVVKMPASSQKLIVDHQN